MGKVIAMTRCPFHGDTDPSLAIYDNGYYCFGCHKSGKLEQWMIDLAHEKPVTESSLHKGRAKKIWIVTHTCMVMMPKISLRKEILD
jgi:hypothetical protein